MCLCKFTNADFLMTSPNFFPKLTTASATLSQNVRSASAVSYPATSNPSIKRLTHWSKRTSQAEMSFANGGSGFGVVAMLAQLLEFQTYGIEIEDSLVVGAQQLADEFDLPVDFVCGSFVPEGGEHIVDELCSGTDSWLTGVADDAYQELGLSPNDFDVVYAFPWPGEENVIAGLFDEFCAVGSLLLTFDHLEGVRVRRKVVRK